ncbi:hypothetical protein BTO08_18535 [Photobacterium angustum]|uniref:Uncharacterized protein n=2 Tax=Photobacterium angustum TaxID=661 RepID=A0A2S7VKR4_PHOAN|nr:hypothetical protein BTO08_18535 [Photobacterium angustum]
MMVMIIVSLVLAGVIGVLLHKVPKEKKTLSWAISSLILILSIAVSASGISDPHLLFSSYIKIDDCYSNQFNLVEVRRSKSRTTFKVLEGEKPKSIELEGGLGYWVGSEPDRGHWSGENITITQCPYWGYGVLSNMVAKISINDEVIFTYRSKNDYLELQRFNRFFGFVLLPISLLLFIILQVYVMRRTIHNK